MRGVPRFPSSSSIPVSRATTTSASSRPTTGRAGEWLRTRSPKALPKGGKVVILRYAEGSASTTEREEGFLEEIGKHADIEVVSSNQYGGADVEGAYKKAEAMLHRFRRPDGSLGVDGIFASNESTTLADAARAAGQRLGRQGEVHRLRRLRHARQRLERRRTSTASSFRIR